MLTDTPALLDSRQRARLDAYTAEMERVNRRVNLVARAATREDLRRHVRHCLVLATRPFPEGAVVVDWGTGGGLPAVPLAVAFPEVTVVAVDAVGKKTEAVKLFARRLELDNLVVWNGRAEVYDGPAPHYSVSRATAPLATLWDWHTRVRLPLNAPREAWTPGLLTLKGGDLTAEIEALHEAAAVNVETTSLLDLFEAEWADKSLVHVTEGIRPQSPPPETAHPKAVAPEAD